MAPLTKTANSKLIRFLDLTLKGSEVGRSQTSESSESTESSETTETSEDSENSETSEDDEAALFLDKLKKINPAPDEWDEIVATAELVLSSRLAKS